MISLQDFEDPSRYVCKSCGQHVVEETQNGPLKLACPACGSTDWLHTESQRYKQWVERDVCILTQIPHQGLYVPYSFMQQNGQVADGNLAIWLVDPDFFQGGNEPLSQDKVDEILQEVQGRPVAFYDHGWQCIKDGQTISWEQLDIEDHLPSFISPPKIAKGCWVQFWHGINKATFLNNGIADNLPELYALLGNWEREIMSIRREIVEHMGKVFRFQFLEEEKAIHE